MDRRSSWWVPGEGTPNSLAAGDFCYNNSGAVLIHQAPREVFSVSEWRKEGRPRFLKPSGVMCSYILLEKEVFAERRGVLCLHRGPREFFAALLLVRGLSSEKVCGWFSPIWGSPSQRRDFPPLIMTVGPKIVEEFYTQPQDYISPPQGVSSTGLPKRAPFCRKPLWGLRKRSPRCRKTLSGNRGKPPSLGPLFGGPPKTGRVFGNALFPKYPGLCDFRSPLGP